MYIKNILFKLSFPNFKQQLQQQIQIAQITTQNTVIDNVQVLQNQQQQQPQLKPQISISQVQQIPVQTQQNVPMLVIVNVLCKIQIQR